MDQAEDSRVPALIGRYRVKGMLGLGGMGVVYAAYDPELDRDVAVKLLLPGRFRESAAAASERLRREARITAKLAHPHVVTIYDVGRHEGHLYIAMELVDGPSLLEWMERVARPWREVTRMFFGAGLGLAAAHDAGLIHRDFKPANVLVGDRRARVVDFGLARVGTLERTPPVDEGADILATTPDGPGGAKLREAMSSPVARPRSPADSGVADVSEAADTLVTGRVADVVSTGGGLDQSLVGVTQKSVTGATIGGQSLSSSDVFVGTPAYMAPELFTGGGADARTDQFAFCVSLYEGLYGERPFAGDTASKIADNVLAHRVREPPERVRVPGWMRTIVLRGLAVDPDERHPSVKSMLASIAFTARIMFD
jgi:serine/threonine protein kinase